MTWRELEDRLVKDGWKLDRQSGSHRIFVHGKKHGIIVLSGHQGSEQVGKGMLSKLLKQAGLK
ncbi:MAG: type II toxin-antitoxin system HicA family toxin [Armatimonadetes bacterium]|nr:type II toxin-antitoxin system HicA family toxin [Armatimonadota bacterium]